MNEFKHFVLIVASMVVLLLFPVIWVMPVEASHPENVASSPDEEEIKNTIQTYFEARYRIFTTLQPNGFDNLISDQPDARNFLDNELGKLTVEIKHTELNHLRYVKYKFFLDFKDISIDNTTKMADVYVTVGHEVIREI